MKRRRLDRVSCVVLKLIIVAALTAMLPGCGDGGGNGSSTVTLKVGQILPDEHPTTQAIAFFKQRLEELAPGRIKVKLFPNGQLGGADELIAQAQAGNVEAAVVSAAPLAQHVEVLNVLVMPFVFRDANHMYAVLDGDVGNALRESISQKGLVGAAFFDAGSRNIMTKKGPVTKPSDLEGMKIRVMGSSVLQAAVERLGAAPVPMSQGEVYGALQTGVIDGWENNPATCLTFSMYETGCTHFAWTRHVAIADVFILSKPWYEKLDSELRSFVDQAVADTQKKQRELWRANDTTAIEKLKEAGMTFNEVDAGAFAAKLEGFYDQYIKKYGPEFADILAKIQGHGAE